MKKPAMLLLIASFLFMPAWALTGQQSAAPRTSKATSDVLRLAAAGVGDDILLTYVQSYKSDFHLDADDIIALKGAKVGSSVVQAMLAHDAALDAASGTTTAPTSAPLNPNPSAGAAPLTEIVPMAPGPDYYWVPGYWSWENGSRIWIYGGWWPYGYIRVHHHRRF